MKNAADLDFIYICAEILSNNKMPEIFRMFGLRFFFYSQDHEPIHVHVSNGDGEAIFIVIPEVMLKEAKGFKVKDLTLAKRIV